jgi:hypothetical protein
MLVNVRGLAVEAAAQCQGAPRGSPHGGRLAHDRPALIRGGQEREQASRLKRGTLAILREVAPRQGEDPLERLIETLMADGHRRAHLVLASGQASQSRARKGRKVPHAMQRIPPSRRPRQRIHHLLEHGLQGKGDVANLMMRLGGETLAARDAGGGVHGLPGPRAR